MPDYEPGEPQPSALHRGRTAERQREIDAEAGKSYVVGCNVKQSLTRARQEMTEVTKSSADKQMEKMTLVRGKERLNILLFCLFLWKKQKMGMPLCSMHESMFEG